MFKKVVVFNLSFVILLISSCNFRDLTPDEQANIISNTLNRKDVNIQVISLFEKSDLCATLQMISFKESMLQMSLEAQDEIRAISHRNQLKRIVINPTEIVASEHGELTILYLLDLQKNDGGFMTYISLYRDKVLAPYQLKTYPSIEGPLLSHTEVRSINPANPAEGVALYLTAKGIDRSHITKVEYATRSRTCFDKIDETSQLFSESQNVTHKSCDVENNIWSFNPYYGEDYYFHHGAPVEIESARCGSPVQINALNDLLNNVN
jgi:hypothetical protein